MLLYFQSVIRRESRALFKTLPRHRSYELPQGQTLYLQNRIQATATCGHLGVLFVCFFISFNDFIMKGRLHTKHLCEENALAREALVWWLSGNLIYAVALTRSTGNTLLLVLFEGCSEKHSSGKHSDALLLSSRSFAAPHFLQNPSKMTFRGRKKNAVSLVLWSR